MTEEKKSLFRTFASGSIIILGSTVAIQLVALIATLFILRFASVYDYGLWRLVLSVLGIFELLTFPGLDAVLMADSARELGAGNVSLYKGIMYKMIVSYALFGCVAAVVLGGLAPLITFITHVNMTVALFIIAVTLITSGITRSYTVAFTVNMRFALVQWMSFLNSLIYVIALGLFLIFHHIDITSIVISYTLAAGLPILIFFPFFLQVTFMRKASVAPYRLLQTIRQHGKWAIALDYANEGSNFLKPWIVNYFLGVEAVGIFSAATSMLSVIANAVPVNQILASVLPYESHDRDKMGFIFQRTLKYWFWCYAIFSIITILVAPTFIRIVFPKYTSSIPLLLIMLISLFATAISNATSQVLNTFRRQKDLLVSTVAPRVVSLLAVLPVLLRWIGILGAAFDQILTSYGSAIMRERYIGDLPELKIRWFAMLQFDDFDRKTFLRVWSGIRSRIRFI